MNRISLEKEAEAVCIENANPPLIFQLPPKEGREVLEKAQDTPVCMYPAEITSCLVDTGKWGTIRLYHVAPKPEIKTPNVIFYIHGAGWQLPHPRKTRARACRANKFGGFISRIFPRAGSKISHSH